MTPTRLAELSDLTSGAVTGVLDRLERAGFVRRESDPNDRRRLLVRVDPEAARRARGAVRADHRAGRRRRCRGEPGCRRRRRRVPCGPCRCPRPRGRSAAGRATYGGIIDDAYRVPIGDVARARLVLHTGAPRLNLGASGVRPAGADGRRDRRDAAHSSAQAKPDGELIRASFDRPSAGRAHQRRHSHDALSPPRRRHPQPRDRRGPPPEPRRGRSRWRTASPTSRLTCAESAWWGSRLAAV